MSEQVIASAETLAAIEAIEVPGAAKEAVPEAGKPEDKPVKESSEGSDERPETESESETDKHEDEQERDEQGRFTSKRGIEKRFKRYADRVSALEAEIAALRGTGGATPKSAETETPKSEAEPKLESFETYEQYTRALARWEARQLLAEERQASEKREAEKRQQEAQERWNEQQAKASAKYEDFDEVMADAKLPRTPATPVLMQFFGESEFGGDVAYHLAKHPDELQRIAAMTPLRAAAELGKLEDRFAKPVEQPKKVSSKAPDPIKPVGSAGTKAFDPFDPNVPYDVWLKERNKAARQ